MTAAPRPGANVDDLRRARRIEVGVYVFAAVSLVVLGIFLTSKILNWIVGPAYVVVVVCFGTPLALKWFGLQDPDQKPASGAERPSAD